MSPVAVSTQPLPGVGGAERRRTPTATAVVGGFYLSMGGVHLGIVAADPQTYRGFADAALFSFVRDGWTEVFMAHPAPWGLALFVGETVIGVLLLRGGRAAQVGWVAVVAFHLLLMLFGWGVWTWSVPVLVLTSVVLRREWPRLAPLRR